MKEPNWLLKSVVIAVHKMLISEHGGVGVLRDEGLLDSALSRPLNRMAYDEQANLFELAAAYAYGLARNHPFVDGNKRIALTAVAMFLGDNGYKFGPQKMDALTTFLKLAAGELAEDELADWIAANAEKAS